MKKTWKYDYDISVLTREDANSFYLLGAFMSDGNVNKNEYSISLSSKDYDWLSIIRQKLVTNYNDFLFDIRQDFYLCNKNLVKWFLDHGCEPIKSLTVKFPVIPKQYMADFLRGIVDGDGHVGMTTYFHKQNNKYYDQYSAYICSSSNDFINGLKDFLKCNDFAFSFTTIKNNKSYFAKEDRFIEQKHDHYRICFSERTAYYFLKFIYYDGCELFMPRKNNVAQECISYYDAIINNPHKNTKYHYPSNDELIKIISENGYSKAETILKIPKASLIYRVRSRQLNIRR